MRREALVMLVLTIQLLQLTANTASISLTLPHWVDESSGFNVTLSLSGMPGGPAHVRLAVLEGERELLSRTVWMEVSGNASALIPIDPLRPGIYRIIATVSVGNSSFSQSEEIYVAPSSASMLGLLSNVSRIEGELGRVRAIVRNATLLEEMMEERRRIYEGMGDLVKLMMLKRDSREALLLFKNISESIDRLQELMSSLGGYEAFIWSTLSSTDSLFRFPAETQQFWPKLLPALALLLLLLLVLSPLYAIDHYELARYLSEGGDSGGAPEESLKRVRRIFRISKKEIESFEEGKSYIMLILASLLASVGLMANNSTAIIGSMLLSSLMGVIIACSMNLAIHTSRDREPLKLFHRGIRNTIIGIALVTLSSYAIALIGSFFIPLRPTPELIARSSPNLTDLMIAVCAGAVGSLSVFYREEIGSLVGSAIAIALVPPAAAVGISAAMMDPSLLSGTIFLLAANVIALILTGYLSARVYVIMPAFRRLLKQEKGNPARSIYELSKAWLRAVTGVAGGGSLRDSLLSLARRVRSVLLLPLISSFLAFLMTTELGKLPSEAHSKLIEMISGISLLSPLKIPRWAPLLLSLAVAALSGASLFYGVRGFEGKSGKGRLAEIVLSSFLLWLSLGYILGIHVLSSIAMIFTLSLAFLLFVSLYKPLRSWRTVIMLLIVLTLTALLMNSASIFGELSRQGLYSSGFVELSREIISSHFGVLPEDVAVSLEGDGIRAVVRVDLVKLEELRGISGMEGLIESYLSEMTGRKVSVTVELALKPP